MEAPEASSSWKDFFQLTQAHHIVLEALLILWVIWLILKKNNKREIKLTEKEEEALINDYEPEPLVPEVPSTHYALNPRIVHGKAGKFVNIDGISCLNFATHNYLDFIGNEIIEQKAIQTLKNYGVGSCGPRGFYGTTEVHLDLEKRLAEFMGTEDAAVYSYAFATVASAIPAYAKRGDIIFVDEKANFAIQKGLDASRSTIKYFKHNDTDDLYRLLEETAKDDIKHKKKAKRSRRFLVVEGIYANTGLICPLKELVELSKMYKLRLFIDESISFGVLGVTGRGVTEHFKIPRVDVDLIMGSLEGAIAAVGGFCVGTTYIVDHQRLSGLGYCFSASQPPLLAMAAVHALEMIDDNPEMLHDLSCLCHLMHDNLNHSKILVRHFDISGDAKSPVHLLNLRNWESEEYGQYAISEIMEECLQAHIAVSRASFLDKVDKAKITPCLRIITSTFLTEDLIKKLVDTLETACLKIFSENS